jgi:hypothetical protein
MRRLRSTEVHHDVIFLPRATENSRYNNSPAVQRANAKGRTRNRLNKRSGVRLLDWGGGGGREDGGGDGGERRKRENGRTSEPDQDEGDGGETAKAGFPWTIALSPLPPLSLATLALPHWPRVQV